MVGIDLRLSEPSADPELYAQVEAGEIDLAFCSLPHPDGPFACVELMRDPYVLLVPADSKLARRRGASLADLGDTPLIGANHCASATVVEEVLAERGFAIGYSFRSDDNTTLQGLVAASFGVALTPLLAVLPGDDRVKAVRLEPKVPDRQLGVVWHRDRHRTAAGRAFVEIAREVSVEVERELVRP